MIKRLINYFTAVITIWYDYFTRRDLIKRIEALEKLAHPKCGLEGFDGYEPLIKRIETIEEKTKENAS